MKLFFVAGEPSGDLHAANCMKELLKINSQITFAFTGGQRMETVCGVKSLIPIEKMAFMGFLEVVSNLRTIQKNFTTVKKYLLEHKPNALILVDYPGFNLKIAKWAFKNNIRVYYYISPTVWAWKKNRAEYIRKYVRKLFTILPFEKEFYAKMGIDVAYVGHPLLDSIEAEKRALPSKETFIKQNNLSEKPIIAVLPGSRKQEVERMLHVMLSVQDKFPEYQFVVAGTTSLPKSIYTSASGKRITCVYNQTYALMNYACAGIIKSGTSTLESALMNLPQVVCYKTGNISFSIAKKLVNVKYISLVNLILDKPCVKELIQNECNNLSIEQELKKILSDERYKQNMLNDYNRLSEMLGSGGASKKIAQLIMEDLNR